MLGSRKAFKLVGVLALLVLIAVILGIAISNFLVFNVRAKQAEARAGLKKMFAAQTRYFAAHGTYAEDALLLTELSDWIWHGCFVASGPTFLRSDSLSDEHPDAGFAGFSQRRHQTTRNLKRPLTAEDLPPSLSGERLGLRDCPGPKCATTMACIGDLDADPALDVWSVSTVERKNRDGERIPAGEPYNDFDDVRDRQR